MAKNIQNDHQEVPEGASLAERLFANNWQSSAGYTAESVASKCIDAAEAFYKALRERAEQPQGALSKG